MTKGLYERTQEIIEKQKQSKIKTYQEHPEIKEKHSKSIKKSWQNPEVREKHIKSNQKRWSKSEEHEKHSKAMSRRHWKISEEGKENIIKGQKLRRKWSNLQKLEKKLNEILYNKLVNTS